MPKNISIAELYETARGYARTRGLSEQTIANIERQIYDAKVEHLRKQIKQFIVH